MRMPNDTERHAIYGMTGTGKTVFGLWCLSQRSFDKIPWIILDFKRDPLIQTIPGLSEIDIADNIPKHKGLYVVRPMPADIDDGAVTSFLYRIWQKERTGLMIDEGYMIPPRDRGLRAILTQGRSKRIPVIALSQKPTWVSPFIHSESEFKSTFFLQMPGDIERVQEWMPATDQAGRVIDPYTLPDHHSYWYSLKGRELVRLGPCPDEDAVLTTFDERRVRQHFL